MADYGWLPQIDTSALFKMGQGIANRRQNNRMGDALSSLPPGASWEDRARAVMQLDPQLGVKMLQYGDTLNATRERTYMDAASRGARVQASQAAQNQKIQAKAKGAAMFAKQADDLATYADNVGRMPGLDAATGAYKPTGDPAVDRLFQYIPADLISDKPGGDAAAFNAAKKTLKAKIGFTELQAMRNASATGGALGQVAVQEIDFLQNSIAALDGIQDPDQLRKSIADISAHYRRLAEIMRDPNWGAETVGGDTESMDAPQVGAVVDGYTFKGGDPNDPNSWEELE